MASRVSTQGKTAVYTNCVLEPMSYSTTGDSHDSGVVYFPSPKINSSTVSPWPQGFDIDKDVVKQGEADSFMTKLVSALRTRGLYSPLQMAAPTLLQVLDSKRFDALLLQRVYAYASPQLALGVAAARLSTVRLDKWESQIVAQARIEKLFCFTLTYLCTAPLYGLMPRHRDAPLSRQLSSFVRSREVETADRPTLPNGTSKRMRSSKQ